VEGIKQRAKGKKGILKIFNIQCSITSLKKLVMNVRQPSKEIPGLNIKLFQGNPWDKP
jgi:hypothetical protein